MKKIKITSIILALLLTIALFAGCSSSEGTASENTGNTETGQAASVTLDVMMPSHPTFQFNEEWAIVKTVEEATNVTLNVDAILNSGESFDEKLNLAMVSGDLPDLIFPISNSAVKTYGDDGAFINVLDHMDKLPNFSKWYEENKDNVISFLSSDGSLYQFPSYGIQESNRRAWIYRDDIFTEHNLEVPATSDELYDVLKELKTIYPESYPLVFRSELAQFDNIAPLFGTSYMTGNRFMNINESGEFEFGPIDDEFKEMLEYFYKLYDEELIVPNFLSLDTAGWEELVSNEQSFVTIDYISRIDFFNSSVQEINPEFKMAYMPPFVGGSNGEAIMTDTRTGFYGYIIASDTENLDAALAYCDWWFSEEGMALASWGVEGVNHEVVDGEKQWIGVEDQTQMKVDTGLSTYGLYQVYDFDATVQLFSPELQDAYAQASSYDAPMQPILAWNEEEQKVVDTVVVPLTSYVAEQVSMFMTGQRDFAEWDDYVQTVKDMGLDEMTKIHEDAYARLTQ